MRATFAALIIIALVLPQARAQTAKTGEQWQAGVHYSALAPWNPTKVAAGKVEVLELFMYTAPKSREVQPYLERWLAHKAGYVEYRREPAIVFPHARLQARMFYTLRDLGREDLHRALFDWVFDPKHYDTYHTIAYPDASAMFALNREFALAHGIDGNRFTAIYQSPEMNDKLIDAEIAMHSYHVQGTSTIVVNGRYSTSLVRLVPNLQVTPNDFARWFELIDWLCESERARMSAAGSAGARQRERAAHP